MSSNHCIIYHYENSFDPSNPTTNYVAGRDDYGTFSVTAGLSYYIVVSDLCGGTNTGTWEFVLSSGLGFPVQYTAIDVPNTGELKINAGDNVPVYVTAGGEQVKDGGAGLVIPQDYDGNGFDTFIITDTTEIDGVFWYEIWLGAENLVWVSGADID